MADGADVEARVTALLSAGDHRGAATEVIRGYGPRALGYLHRLLGNDTDAADAFSMFAEQVWRGMPNFEGRSSVKTWAFKAAWSAAMKVRDDAWRRLREGLPSSAASHLADEVRTNTALRLETLRQELEVLRAELTAEDQTLLALRLDQELTWDEVAEVLSIEGRAVDAATLRKRYERIKGRLAAIVRERRDRGPG
ncbi:MAG TPA: sigma-70 family RNA polymerase sigma factor [Anaeromyxobacter sp.]|nr:sigma-70 family RNA polymerase sigma factor [Anaeromyxobacter sp.]